MCFGEVKVQICEHCRTLKFLGVECFCNFALGSISFQVFR